MSTVTSVGTVSVSHYDSNGTWLIALEGDHDLSTTPLLEQQTTGVWPHCTLAVIDLSMATFIDCSVINWLLHIRNAPAEAGHYALRIVHGPPGSAAARMCSILSLRDTLAWYPTRQEALTAKAADPDIAA